jgi:hypothetical protein
MIQTINVSDFRDAFRACGRADQFSYEGLGALFDYLEDFDGGGYELDVIALCCDYAEEFWEGIAKNYLIDLEGCETEQDSIEAVREYLDDRTQIVAELDGRFLYSQF